VLLPNVAVTWGAGKGANRTLTVRDGVALHTLRDDGRLGRPGLDILRGAAGTLVSGVDSGGAVGIGSLASGVEGSTMLVKMVEMAQCRNTIVCRWD
jgi:hypothetical protein